MQKKVRNPTLAEDGLPQEMFSDVLRACDRWLTRHDPFYEMDKSKPNDWNRNKKQTTKHEKK